MKTKLFNYDILYEKGEDFFLLRGNCYMRLTPNAAIEVCQEAIKQNLWILGVDAGHWFNPGFRPDGWMSWDRKKELFNQGKLIENNQLAIENIKEDEAAGYTAFIVTISK